MRRTLAILASLLWLAPARAQVAVQLPVNVPLTGCVEGRAVRVINGITGCAPGVAPTLSGCGTGSSLSPNATDFGGKITTGTGLISSCTLVLSKLYTNPGMGCLVQSNSAAALATTPVVGSNGSATTITIPLSVSVTGATITYACFPV